MPGFQRERTDGKHSRTRKLTDEKVAALRAVAAVLPDKKKEIAALFGISLVHCQSLARGKGWTPENER